MIIQSKKVWIADQFFAAAIEMENGKIVNVLPYGSKPADVDYGNKRIVPGFLDIHCHGAYEFDTNDANEEGLRAWTKGMVKEGTTALLATTITQSEEVLTNAVANVAKVMEEGYEGAEILGVHLEGPFISKDFIGAQPLEYVAEPNVEVFKHYEEVSGNNIKLVSMAVEVEGAEKLVSYLASRGIVASIGHSNAKYADVEKAIKAGASNVTHTYNAQKPIHHREVGTVGSAMLFDELTCEAICDGIHLSGPAIKLLWKNKPADKFVLITDAMRAKHMPDGDYELGGQPVIVRNNEARLPNGVLAGSVLRMNYAVRNVMKFLDLPLEEVVKYASINPARNLGIDHEVGSIKVGKRANLVVVDENLEVYMTIRDGIVIYQKEN